MFDKLMWWLGYEHKFELSTRTFIGYGYMHIAYYDTYFEACEAKEKAKRISPLNSFSINHRWVMQ